MSAKTMLPGTWGVSLSGGPLMETWQPSLLTKPSLSWAVRVTSYSPGGSVTTATGFGESAMTAPNVRQT